MPQGEKTVTDTEIVQWMRETPEPAFTTAEIAEKFDMTAEGMRGRLEALRDGKQVYRKNQLQEQSFGGLTQITTTQHCQHSVGVLHL